MLKTHLTRQMDDGGWLKCAVLPSAIRHLAIRPAVVSGLLVVAKLWNPGREPCAIPAAADQKYGTEAVVRRRIQRIVDSKIAIRLERNTSDGGVAFDKGR